MIEPLSFCNSSRAPIKRSHSTTELGRLGRWKCGVEQWRRVRVTSLFKRTEGQIARGKLDERQKEGLRPSPKGPQSKCLTSYQPVDVLCSVLPSSYQDCDWKKLGSGVVSLISCLYGEEPNHFRSILACYHRTWPLLFGRAVR
jgi:hypothetical protein